MVAAAFKSTNAPSMTFCRSNLRARDVCLDASRFVDTTPLLKSARTGLNAGEGGEGGMITLMHATVVPLSCGPADDGPAVVGIYKGNRITAGLLFRISWTLNITVDI